MTFNQLRTTLKVELGGVEAAGKAAQFAAFQEQADELTCGGVLVMGSFYHVGLGLSTEFVMALEERHARARGLRVGC